MESSNTNNELRRRAENELADEASTSKQPYIDYGTVGANIDASGHSSVHIDSIYVTRYETLQQQKAKKPLRGIRFQVTDPVASFGGRDVELDSVQRAFDDQNNKKPYNLVAVCGYGGIGKTEFARKFIKNNRAKFVNIGWIYSEFESTLCDSFNKLQKELERRGYPCSDQQDVYEHFNNPECLLVFDNADNTKCITKYLPQGNNNSLFLITSQYLTWSPYKSIELDKLDPTSAINVMKVVLGTHGIEISERQQLKLLSALEPIPLVLQIGVGFVCQEVLGLKSIGKEYNIDDIIGELSTECELVTLEFPPFDQSLYDKSVLVALSRTLEKFWNKDDKVSKTAKSMLGVAAYLSADRIEEDMLKGLLNKDDQKLFNKALSSLAQFSLFQKSNHSFKSIYTMHRTVQECVRHFCRKSNPNQCYLQSLHVLLHSNYRTHHALIIIQHAEKDFETFKSFYEGNKCRTQYVVLMGCISYNLLQQILDKTNSINDPEFLCEAAASKRNDIVKKLLEHGANFNVMNSEGLGVLYYACLQKEDFRYCIINWRRIKALIKVGANINLQNSQGNTVLHILCNTEKNCAKRDVYIFGWCALMIKAEADPTVKNSAGKTAADLAQEHGLPLTQRLLEEVMSGCRYIQHIAARCKQFKFLRSLIIFDIWNINEQDESGSTVLHVLAGLDPLPEEDELNEIELVYFTTDLMTWNRTYVIAVKNNFGEMAADVATRANRVLLANMFNARAQDHTIYHTAVYRQQIHHFSFVSNQDENHVNDKDNSGGTLLHALCGLDPHGDTNLELEVMKPVADLVIHYHADMSIMNNAGDTAVDVARSRGWRLLADFLDGVDATVDIYERRSILRVKLMYLAVKHRQPDLINYAWWRFYDFKGLCIKYVPVEACCRVLCMMCGYEDPAVTDSDIISALNVLDIFKQVAKYDMEGYQKAIDVANKCGRNELANWLISNVN